LDDRERETLVSRGVIVVLLLVLGAANDTTSRAAAPRIAVPSTGEEFEVDHVRANVEFLLRILNGESEGTLEDASLWLGREDGPEERAERRCCGERFTPGDAASNDDLDLSAAASSGSSTGVAIGRGRRPSISERFASA
jgi:hypothetical protein